jgi:hypothetical protein
MGTGSGWGKNQIGDWYMLATSRKIATIAVIAAFSLGFTAFGANKPEVHKVKTGGVVVKVSDATGAAREKAGVVLIKDMKVLSKAETDAKGECKVQFAQDGDYLLLVNGMTTLKVTAAATNKAAEIKVTLPKKYVVAQAPPDDSGGDNNKGVIFGAGLLIGGGIGFWEGRHHPISR